MICAEFFLQFRNSSFAIRVGQIYNCYGLQNIIIINLIIHFFLHLCFKHYLKHYLPFKPIFARVSPIIILMSKIYVIYNLRKIYQQIIFYTFGILLNYLCSISKQFSSGAITDSISSAGDKHGFLLNLHYRCVLFSSMNANPV